MGLKPVTLYMHTCFTIEMFVLNPIINLFSNTASMFFLVNCQKKNQISSSNTWSSVLIFDYPVCKQPVHFLGSHKIPHGITQIN